ncbi:MAG: DUF814 domain-containing protein [Spirochaetaceae bacterium]|nr:MAG: DUF814 domain-containing protein [Spirochaetaceae bacterium]
MTGLGTLNNAEINALIVELDITGSHIQEIHEPGFGELVFDLWGKGKMSRLYVCVKPPDCRFHLFTGEIQKGKKPQRFVTFLRANVRGHTIVNVVHVNDDRIIKITTVSDEGKVILWFRLWGSNPNCIVTDTDGNILDALWRRPGRGEISGGSYLPESGSTVFKDNRKIFTVRDFPGSGSLNQRVEEYYSSAYREDSLEKLSQRVMTNLLAQEARLASSVLEMEKSIAEKAGFSRFRELGDLVMGCLGSVAPGTKWLSCDDFFNDNRKIEIELDTAKTAEENARVYYEQYKKNRKQHEKLVINLGESSCDLAVVQQDIRLAEQAAQMDDPAVLSTLDKKYSGKRKSGPVKDKQKTGASEGLMFESMGFSIMVGRTAKENEKLMKKMRGNDLWLHTRDFAGAYVFIRSKSGKSIPLDVLLDAGNLAIKYSKGKNSGKADLYYTQVKNLKRIKGAKAGLVIPTQEKNLRVAVDESRLSRLRGNT